MLRRIIITFFLFIVVVHCCCSLLFLFTVALRLLRDDDACHQCHTDHHDGCIQVFAAAIAISNVKRFVTRWSNNTAITATGGESFPVHFKSFIMNIIFDFLTAELQNRHYGSRQQTILWTHIAAPHTSTSRHDEAAAASTNGATGGLSKAPM